MANFGDIVVQFPISGSDLIGNQPRTVYSRFVQQVSSASVYIFYHPGGSMTGSVQLAPRNLNRVRFTLLNSGSLDMGLAHGNTFDPRISPPTIASHWDNVIQGTTILKGNQGSIASLEFEAKLPCYTGPINVAWFGSGTLSGSAVIMTEYVDQS